MLNRTPKGIAVVSAGLITGLLATAYFVTAYILDKNFEILLLLSFLILAFCISYVIIFYFIEKFLYHKVKIIYKTIHSFKTQRDEKPRIRMSKDVLNEVNEEVADWAKEKIEEVKALRTQENFRQEFIGNLSHELKTPIFSIQGYIDTLLDGDYSNPELTRKFLQKASASCDRLSDLVNDLDLLTNLESSSIPLNLTRFDIVELALKCINSLEDLTRERNIGLRLRNRNEKPLMVEADKKRIEQVFVNLLMNSVNYGKNDGETRIRFYDMGDNVLVEVADNGIGMTKEHLPRLFERFYRVDKSRSRNEGGSGLGLAICKHIVESHNQTISVRSTEDIGSTFSFTLRKANKMS
jgi:two-component system, OmpR family, phosphate regulon sensor histidine kinase PhoR